MRGQRLPGLGMYFEYIVPPHVSSRPKRIVEFTRECAEQWDHDILNRAPIAREIMTAVKSKARLPNGYSVDFCYRGRTFATWYPSEAET